MDFSALMLSVEATRQDARSALPDAEVRPAGGWWRRLSASVRRLIRSRAAQNGTGEGTPDYSP